MADATASSLSFVLPGPPMFIMNVGGLLFLAAYGLLRTLRVVYGLRAGNVKLFARFES